MDKKAFISLSEGKEEVWECRRSMQRYIQGQQACWACSTSETCNSVRQSVSMLGESMGAVAVGWGGVARIGDRVLKWHEVHDTLMGSGGEGSWSSTPNVYKKLRLRLRLR